VTGLHAYNKMTNEYYIVSVQNVMTIYVIYSSIDQQKENVIASCSIHTM